MLMVIDAPRPLQGESRGSTPTFRLHAPSSCLNRETCHVATDRNRPEHNTPRNTRSQAVDEIPIPRGIQPPKDPSTWSAHNVFVENFRGSYGRLRANTG